MKCLKAKKMISEYIDGELPEILRAKLEAHLDACQECNRVFLDFQQIVLDAKDLEMYTPPQKSWGKIRSMLVSGEKESKTFIFTPGFKVALGAAAVVVLVIAAFIFGLQYGKEAQILGPADAREFALAKIEKAEQHYQKAIDALLAAITSPEKKLSPEVGMILQRNIDVLDFSITAYKEAVLQDPEDIKMMNFLLAAYQEKVDFLNKIIELNEEASRAGSAQITL